MLNIGDIHISLEGIPNWKLTSENHLMAFMIDSDRRPVSNRRPLTSLSQITVQF
jgi:hypothetical protein